MKSIAENRRARYDYTILDSLEAGVALLGHEVKSAKAGRWNLVGAYVVAKGGELWLVGSDIPPYQPKNIPDNYDPQRSRRILLHKKEIASLIGKRQGKGLTLIPLRAYLKRGLIKLEVGVGKSRKKRDKRELLKKRAAEREMRGTP